MDTGRILLPVEYAEVEGPVIFLAGPIQGAQDWQSEAAKILHQLRPAVHVASPRREYLDGEFVYNDQVDWETHHLRRAAQYGAVLFWLAKEFAHDHGRAYAQTTRFEIAEWKVRHERDHAKLAVGIEDGFTGAKYIRRRFSQDCPGVPFADSLEETCRNALKLLEA